MIWLSMALSIATVANAEFGACRFDVDKCSCKIGAANQGTCWDPVPGVTGQCKSRSCKAGWTCACGGRTHLCTKGSRNAFRVADADKTKSEAACNQQTISAVAGRELELGSFTPRLSRKGVAANACNEIAWWHQGELMGNYKSIPDLTSAGVDDALAVRQDHSLLELRPGDVLAFRFRDASYYCYTHLSDLIVNATTLTTEDDGFEVLYARKFSKDWFLPNAAISIGVDESETDLTKFIPPRTTMFNGKGIVPGEDNWAPASEGGEDHRASNWYWRIKVPESQSSF